MLGAVAGDIIASPYVKKNAHNSTFEMFASVHEYHDGKTTTYYPKVTDATVMTLAVARWISTDPEHRKGTFISCMQEAFARYPDCGFSPTMGIWCNSEFFRPFTRETNDPVARVSPIGLSVDDLKDAIDLARMSAEFTHTNPDSIKGAEALTMAIWQACHGRSKDDIRFAMENDYGIDFSLPEADLKSILMGAQKEDIMINGEPTGESYYRESNKIDYSTMNTLTAALRSFLEGNSFVDVVRRAVALGGDSTTITSMAGALAHAFYKEIPEVIVKECSKKMENDLKNTMESFELSLKKQPAEEPEKKVEQTNDLAFHIIKTPVGDRLFVVDPHRKELISGLKGRFGNDIKFILPKEMQSIYKEMCKQEKDGTYVEKKRPEIRTIYFQNGEFRTAVTMEGETFPEKDKRIAARQVFCNLVDYAKEVKKELYDKVGYIGDGDIHFANAYYPVIYHDKIEIFRGDIFAGSVGIDPNNGLLRIDQGGDFGPMEWFGERTESVFKSVSFDSIKEAIGHFCLDEGVGVDDNKRRVNIEVANDDIATSKDETLINNLKEAMDTPKKSMKL